MPIIKNKPYHIQAYELIKAMILSGELKCGEKISDVKFSQDLRISRSPVREAFRILEQDSLIVHSSAGYMVNPMEPETLSNVYECRIGLESYASRLAIRNFTKADHEILIRSVADCRKAEAEGDFMTLIDLNTLFHDHIASLTNNVFIIAQLERISNIIKLSRIKELQQDSCDLSYAYKDHLEIADLLLEGEGDAVENLMRKHLSNNLSSLLV